MDSQLALIERVAKVAHDIRSPIATIEMSLYLLSEEMQNEKFKIIRSALQNLRDITNDLIAKYQINPSSYHSLTGDQFDNDIVNFSELLESVIALKRYEWLNKSYDLQFTLDADARYAALDKDIIGMKRMLSNILNNAIEACVTSAKINVHLGILDGRVCVSIKDNGRGMDKENIAHFLSGNSSKHPGKGLGLSGAISYMKHIGGCLNIQSAPEKGTLIQIIL